MFCIIDKLKYGKQDEMKIIKCKWVKYIKKNICYVKLLNIDLYFNEM